MESAIYAATSGHRRFQPVRHEFTYPVFMAFLDIDRIPELMKVSPFASYNRFNWASFRSATILEILASAPSAPVRDAAAQGVTLYPTGPYFCSLICAIWATSSIRFHFSIATTMTAALRRFSRK